MQDLEQTIRERAYHFWIADGRRDGNADAHWLDAQREVLATSLGTFGRVPIDNAQAPTCVKKKAHKAATKGKRRAA